MVYTPPDISMIIAGAAAAFATIIYSCKHVKKSNCCGFSCEQEVIEEANEVVPISEHQDIFINTSDV